MIELSDDVETSSGPVLFSVRVGGQEPPEQLYEGVPAWMAPLLLDWLRRHADTWAVKQIALRLRLSLESERVDELCSVLRSRIQESDRGQWDLLDALDIMLYMDYEVNNDLFIPQMTPTGEFISGSAPVSNLDWILTQGGSAYTVTKRGRLERRVVESVSEMYSRIVKDASQIAGRHLTRAWNATYGLDPNPDLAYSEAVKAAEAVACPLLAPKDLAPTLGKAINNLRDSLDKWRFTIEAAGNSVETILGMLQILWKGHESRHAGGANSRDQDQSESEAAIFLSGLIVQWFSTGALVRKP